MGNLRQSYKTYKAKEENPVDIKTYLSITKGYMKFLIRKLFNVGEIRIPERLGTLTITGRKVKVQYKDGKIKGLAPDWASTKKLWAENPEAKANKQLLYHFNEESNGIRYKFTWGKSRVLVSNKTLYGLRMTRTNKRHLSNLIKQNKEYIIKD